MNQAAMDTLVHTLILLSPELLVIITAFLVLATDLFARDTHKNIQACSVFGLFSAMVASIMLQFQPNVLDPSVLASIQENVSRVLALDGMAFYLKTLVLFLSLLACLLTYKSFDEEARHPGEFYCLILFATLGQLIAVSSRELVTFFIAFELVSLPLYMLAGFRRYDSRSSEAGIKYFLTGAMSSAIMLFGMSWVYGSLGTTEFVQMGGKIANLHSAPHATLVGLIMIAIGLSYKVSAAPFHNWAPDVYSGAPTVVVSYLSTAPKAAMVGVLLRLFWGSLNVGSTTFAFSADWVLIFAILSLLSMFVGNLSALAQTDVKRMLAYSGVGQIGYLFLGLASCSIQFGAGYQGAGATLFYAAAYTISNFLAWAAVYLACYSAPDCNIERFNGLAKRSPLVAAALLIGFMSLAGVPPLVGFVGKFSLFRAIYEARLPFLVVFGILNSVISLYYYFKVLRAAYFVETDASPLFLTISQRVVLQLTLGLVILLGLWPGLLEYSLGIARAVIQ